MATSVFQDIVARGRASGIGQMTPQQAQGYFRQAALACKGIGGQDLMKQAGPFERMTTISPNAIGKMYCYFYDPKWKDKLPYYDLFPVIFVLDVQPDYILGLNLHYLNPILRARFMNALYTLLNNEKYDKTTKLKLTYKLLKQMSSMRYYKACIKKYLLSHLRSTILYIKPPYWDIAVFLPTAQFVKAPDTQVWQESFDKIYGSSNLKTP